ncbi:MAG: hypothetical protein IPL61_24290 [Myxococcales bacterium]|nr:hypothetical protein [Myxococcales bacterium]
MAEQSSTRLRGTSAAERVLLGALLIAAILGAALLMATAPAPASPGRHWLRAIGGGLCLAAVLVAGTATEALRGNERRRPFISEVLAAFRRRGRSAPRTWAGWIGSLVANALMLGGAMVFLLDALRLGGAMRLAVIATALCLIAVVVEPLREVDPRRAPLRAFAHPLAAAAFYLAAIVLSLVERQHAGPIGQALAAVHVASSGALIALALVASVLEYGWRLAAWPVSGTRILLDTSPWSRARWVRRWQWSSTVVAGAALAGGALGV